MRTVIDFAPGLHGHFLEFVVNKYIYGVNSGNSDIFQSSGAVHAINVDAIYQSAKIADRGHYSSFNIKYPSTVENIVFINHDPELDFVLLTNIFYRCHPDAVNTKDYNFLQIIEFHKNLLIAGSNLDLRNNWFAKLNERHFTETLLQPITSCPVYNFPYNSFFSLVDFCKELKQLSKFLNETFKFDTSLAVLWNNFIDKNQGWVLYNQGRNLINETINGNQCDIPDDWKLHAFINFQLSKLFDLYDGVLFDKESFPATTTDLLEIVDAHIKNFDKRW